MASQEINAGVVTGIVFVVLRKHTAVHIAGTGDALCGCPGSPGIAF